MGLSQLRWTVFRTLFRSIGRFSNGIRLGYQYGFDSGEMLDYVYENKAQGKFLVGRAIDRAYLDAIGWRGIRARKDLLKQVLHKEIAARQVAGRPVVILDVAAGPGRYLQEVCLEMRSRSQPLRDITVLCRDMDAQGLNWGRRRAQERSLYNFRYELGDACDPASLANVQPKPDIVVVSGLYELFTDPVPIQRSLKGINEILNQGGAIIFTTQVRHPQLELIANVLVNREGKPWVMQCRDAATVEGWAGAAGFAVQRRQLESVGLFSVTVAKKVSVQVPPEWPVTLAGRHGGER
ncbi:MAG: class I SAM-dependent methyltransferase family protein [Chloroflexi bacterium]|nr:class I SAM-dependent methyltransferase family protein [Chloroflexota bacterium]